jgi:acyl carrier protein
MNVIHSDLASVLASGLGSSPVRRCMIPCEEYAIACRGALARSELVVDFRELVLSKIRELGKLDPDGTSLLLDSISIIDFVLALEDASGVEIENEDLTVENFRAVDDVVRLLERRAPAK